MFNPEWIGVPAAVLVLLSYIFSNQVKLRVLNIIASAAFVGYGIAIAAYSDPAWTAGWSTVVLNALCVVVHIVWLVRYVKKKKPNKIHNQSSETCLKCPHSDGNGKCLDDSNCID